MEPKITKTNKGWRVDLPDGDFCYQPSAEFAKSYARNWQLKRALEDKVTKGDEAKKEWFRKHVIVC